MNRFRFSIILFIISISSIFAQNNTDAEALINNILSSVQNSAIKSNFTLKVSEKNSVNSHTSSGTILLKANKFYLDLEDTKAWFDGKTQWAYMVQGNEVSITEPTEIELAETNPMAILSAYKKNCFIKFSKKKSSQFHIVEMTPKVKNKDLLKIEVQINKTNSNLASIILTAKNGSTTSLILSSYQKGVKTTDDVFVFNKAKYKNATMNDLR